MQLLLESIMANFDDLMGELGQELKGIAEYWGVDLGLIVGLNLSYEMRRVGLFVLHLCLYMSRLVEGTPTQRTHQQA